MGLALIRRAYIRWLASRVRYHESAISAEFANPRPKLALRVQGHRQKIASLMRRIRKQQDAHPPPTATA